MSGKLRQHDLAVAEVGRSCAKMGQELEYMKARASRLTKVRYVAQATASVLSLSQTFDRYDVNGTGTIDICELRPALTELGLEARTNQAEAILKQYDSGTGVIEVRAFTALVRDIQLLYAFDKDGSGTLSAEELVPALRSLGLETSARHARLILQAWDADNSGRLDLVEFASLVKSMQAFRKFDRDRSGTIEVSELRDALRMLGIRTGTDLADSLLARYDVDGNGTIELHEFAILARDIALFTQYDTDCNGVLDASELRPALRNLAGITDEAQARAILRAWDVDGSESLDIVEFSMLVRDLKVFIAFDTDMSVRRSRFT